MKKLFLILLLSFYLTSCYDYKELKNISFCFGLSIDYNEKEEYKYSFSLETQTPKRTSNDGEFESTPHEVGGDSFAHAISNLSSTTTGLINFAHCKVIFISKEISIDDLKDLAFYLFYNPIISNNIIIVMSNEDTASEILKTKSLTETSASFEIVSALNNPKTYYNYGFKKTLTDLYNDLYGEFGDFMIPTASIIESGENKTASLKGARLYNDFEFKIFLDNDTLREALVQTNVLETVMYNLETKEKLVSLHVDSLRRKTKIKYLNNKFHITHKLKLNISSSEGYKELDEIKSSLIEKLTNDIEGIFKEHQEQDIDIYLLNINLYKYSHKLYKKHIEKFDIKDIVFNVDFDVNIKQRGILR